MKPAGMGRWGLATVCAAALAGAAAASGGAQAAEPHHSGTYTSKTGNVITRVSDEVNPYQPDIAGASSADRARAQKLYDDTQKFCSTYSPADIRATWELTPKSTSHYLHPDADAYLGKVDPANPYQVFLQGDKMLGLTFSGTPLPFVGSIPQAHSHSGTWEMLHVWCADTIKAAFTPNRQLAGLWGKGSTGPSTGATATAKPTPRPTPTPTPSAKPTARPSLSATAVSLRTRIEARLGGLSAAQLRSVLAEVRSFNAGRAMASSTATSKPAPAKSTSAAGRTPAARTPTPAPTPAASTHEHP